MITSVFDFDGFGLFVGGLVRVVFGLVEVGLIPLVCVGSGTGVFVGAGVCVGTGVSEGTDVWVGSGVSVGSGVAVSKGATVSIGAVETTAGLLSLPALTTIMVVTIAAIPIMQIILKTFNTFANLKLILVI